MQNLSQAPQATIHVRCPDCFKQYAVSSAEIVVSKPRFQCTDCDTQFWIAYPEVLEQTEVIGFPTSWIDTSSQKELSRSHRAEEHLPKEKISEPETAGYIKDPQLSLDFQETSEVELSMDTVPTVDSSGFTFESEMTEVERQYPCPKCEKLNPSQTSECQHCGVIMNVYEGRQNQSERFPISQNVSASLKSKWNWVMDHYDDKDVHQRFLKAACLEGQLQYALNKYQNILEAHGRDEAALAMQKQILALTVQDCIGSAELSRASKETPAAKGFLYRSVFSIANVIVVFSTILIALGYFIPSLRNLMGIGASVLFIALALRYHFKLI